MMNEPDMLAPNGDVIDFKVVAGQTNEKQAAAAVEAIRESQSRELTTKPRVPRSLRNLRYQHVSQIIVEAPQQQPDGTTAMRPAIAGHTLNQGRNAAKRAARAAGLKHPNHRKTKE